MRFALHRCRICQNEKTDGERWFLVVGNDWEDRLRILSWSEDLARKAGMQSVCGASHAKQLVAHWMATGSLDYPFAGHPMHFSGTFTPFASLLDFNFPVHGASRALGELAIHRESLEQLLMENPESLVPVLDALVVPLHEEGISEETCKSA